MRPTWALMELIQEAAKYLDAKGVSSARLDAELLMAHTLGCTRVDLYINFDKPLSPQEVDRFRHLIKRRASREPVAYIVGKKEFWSLEFMVNPHVMVPRPDTETLVEAALKELKEFSSGPPLKAADIGTGCGAIAIALAKELGPRVLWIATDISSQALDTARRNASFHEVSGLIEFLEGDLFGPLGTEARLTIIVSNPPYIPTEELEALEPEIKLHEPKIALDGGEDGLCIIRRLISEAPAVLTPGGKLLMEVGASQRAKVEELLKGNAAWVEWGWYYDLGARSRVVWARRG